MTLGIRNTLMPDIKRHLSIIGKRLYTKEGKNLFSDITLSSAEDYQIIQQYVYAAAQDVEAICRPLVSSFTLSGDDVVIVLANSRGASDFESRTTELVKSFIELYTVGEYLAMVHPDIAQKYHADARQRMESLVEYVFFKTPPTAPNYSYSDITGNIN